MNLASPFRRSLLALLSASATALLLPTHANADNPGSAAQPDSLLNASYDVARELFAEINPLFVAHWQKAHPGPFRIDQSYGGTTRQAQDIIQGKKADVVTFNQVTDIDILARRGLVSPDVLADHPAGPDARRTGRGRAGIHPEPG